MDRIATLAAAVVVMDDAANKLHQVERQLEELNRPDNTIALLRMLHGVQKALSDELKALIYEMGE